jgi:hypothetical protein
LAWRIGQLRDGLWWRSVSNLSFLALNHSPQDGQNTCSARSHALRHPAVMHIAAFVVLSIYALPKM